MLCINVMGKEEYTKKIKNRIYLSYKCILRESQMFTN